MKDAIRYGIILALICMAAAGLLAAVNYATQPIIRDQAVAQEQNTLKELLPQASRFQIVAEADNKSYYKGFDSQEQLVGVVFSAASKGYSSVIETMTGMTKEGRITAIKVMNMNETPGLGSRVAEESFLSRFKDRDAQNLNQVQAITGATISSSAVINSVAKRAQELKEVLKNEK